MWRYVSLGVLDGRVAIVTGAGRSVGLGIAQELADAGASVAVNDRDKERAVAALKEIHIDARRDVAAGFDVTNRVAVQQGIAAVERALGPIDILVNNAGIPAETGALGRFKDSAPEIWHEWIDLNLYGSLYMIHAVLARMVERGWGRV